MKRKYLQYIGEILGVSIILTLGLTFFNTKNIVQTPSENENLDNFQSAYISQSALVGIALSTKIGIGNGFIGGNEQGSYTFVSFNGQSDDAKMEIRKNLISQNMIQVRDYLNFSKTNYADVIKTSADRKTTVETLITQLEFRKSLAQASIASLEKTKQELVTTLDKASSDIENTKKSMTSNFSANKADATVGNIESYFRLRDVYTQAFTDIVFINQFLKQYTFLIEYNQGILDTIKLNKQAIIDESYVVVPNSGGAYLEPLNLLYQEDDLKNIKEE